MSDFAPLTGVRIVDLTQVLAGPYCTQLLALMGADVIKVEPRRSGDFTRFGGALPELNSEQMGLLFCTQNTDKRSVTVDLKQPEGIALVERLVAGSDVFVENFRPGVAERLGLGFAHLEAVRSGLVYVSLSAYGHDGPIGHRPAYDHVVQAMSGVMELTGTEQMGPVKVGAPYVDYAAGVKGALATLAAVVEQRRTGESQQVDASMLDAALLLMASTATATANTGERPPKLGNEAASLAPSSGCFETADGLLALAANNERQFRDLCATIGRPELADDERFTNLRVRVSNAEAFRQLLRLALATESAQVWEARFDASGVPASRVRSMDETLTEGQPQARQLFTEMQVENFNLKLPTAGFKVNGTVPAPKQPPPRLGADSDAILSELGYSEDEVLELRDSGVI